jgi:hypothetical protein
MTVASNSLVLGFKPSSHGFAWVAFANPFSIHDWGMSEARGPKNERCLALLERVLDRLNPHLMVLETYEGREACQSARIIRLCTAAAAMARDKGIEVVTFCKNDVQACFVNVGARTRYEIAAAIARSFEVLRHLLPNKRRAWESINRRMALFDAAALVQAHFNLGVSGLFDELRISEPE